MSNSDTDVTSRQYSMAALISAAAFGGGSTGTAGDAWTCLSRYRFTAGFGSI